MDQHCDWKRKHRVRLVVVIHKEVTQWYLLWLVISGVGPIWMKVVCVVRVSARRAGINSATILYLCQLPLTVCDTEDRSWLNSSMKDCTTVFKFRLSSSSVRNRWAAKKLEGVCVQLHKKGAPWSFTMECSLSMLTFSTRSAASDAASQWFAQSKCNFQPTWRNIVCFVNRNVMRHFHLVYRPQYRKPLSNCADS